MRILNMVTTDRLYMIVTAIRSLDRVLSSLKDISNESEMSFLFLKVPNHSEICNNHNNNS